MTTDNENQDGIPVLTDVFSDCCSQRNFVPSQKILDIVTATENIRPLDDLIKQADKEFAPYDLNTNEQYTMQLAGIATAAMGFWKEGDSVHPDYDTPVLHDVGRLYKKYDTLYKAIQEALALMKDNTTSEQWPAVYCLSQAIDQVLSMLPVVKTSINTKD